jgi:S-adenosylmethionine:tRNA ribosyltransferase-isomerase
MNPAALDYDLDPAQIAQRPLEARDAARLLVVARGRGPVADGCVRALGEWLRPGDLLVANDAAVVPARLRGRRETGGAVEVLLTEAETAAGHWQCLARKSGRMRLGERIAFGDGLHGVWGGVVEAPFGRITLEAEEGELARAVERQAELPLPPYITRPDGPSADDYERYQTMFARVPGAIAAPTAGLHFTPELLASLAADGVHHTTVTLLVGAGTFLPLRATHSVPAERFTIGPDAAAAIAATRDAGGRVVAVGTTTVRALESAALPAGRVQAGSGRTDLVIGPGYHFQVVNALITNLHLPGTSLLALVAAFAGLEPTRAAYEAAVRDGYRFYSYGDAMLIQ